MMGQSQPMRRTNIAAVFIAVILFIVPFFWLKPGYVDMGGDAGRLYFLDPVSVAQNTYRSTQSDASASFDMIPYELYLSVLKKIIPSPTALISFEHGLQLSLSFLFIYLIVRTLLVYAIRGNQSSRELTGLTAGIVYVGFISISGWVTALPTQNQVFLNPLIFYLLLKYCLSGSFWYALIILLFTVCYSGSFGFSAMPQIMSFYPIALVFLLIIMRFVFHRKIPWGGLGLAALAFVGLHAYQIVPLGMSLISKNSYYHTYIFTEESMRSSGVHYFAANHETLGKISTALFQPVWPRNILVLLVPFIALWGCIKSRSKLSALAGVFFLLTLFLVSANITKVGAFLYQLLFYIPGFMMFRSFNEKWYMVFAFFFTLFFAFSLGEFISSKNRWLGIMLVIAVTGSTIWRIYPFLTGKSFDTKYYQSDVSRVFTFDPNLLDAVSYARKIPGDGRFLTLPLTFPYYQIAYGSGGGAYVGISLISELAGKVDYPGFWSLADKGQSVFDAIQARDFSAVLRILSDLNVRFIFYDSDPRVTDNFPGFPYIYPGLMYASKDQLPLIQNQSSYAEFLSQLPLRKIYGKGYFTIYKINYPFQVADAKPAGIITDDPYIGPGLVISYATAALLGVTVVWLLVCRNKKS